MPLKVLVNLKIITNKSKNPVTKFRWKHHHSQLWQNYRSTGEWQVVSTCDGGKEKPTLNRKKRVQREIQEKAQTHSRLNKISALSNGRKEL